MAVRRSLFKRIYLFNAQCRVDFMAVTGNLLENEEVRRLDLVKQHYKFTRLRHSIDVAYSSYVIAKLLHLDGDSVARAGLLHDLFFHKEGQHAASLLLSHPKIALENAKKICDLNKIEEDIILSHMFLLTPRPPRYREGYVVTAVDKYCAVKEYIASLFMKSEDCSAKKDFRPEPKDQRSIMNRRS